MIQLKIAGKPFAVKQATPTVQKVIAFLSKSPADELYTGPELAGKIRVSPSWVRNISAGERELQPFTARVGVKRYYGSSKAIAELLRQIA